MIVLFRNYSKFKEYTFILFYFLYVFILQINLESVFILFEHLFNNYKTYIQEFKSSLFTRVNKYRSLTKF